MVDITLQPELLVHPEQTTLSELQYPMKGVALVIPHMLMGDQIETIPAVRYLRLFYQTVHLWVLTKNSEQIRLFYTDDPNIQIIVVGDNWWGQEKFYQSGHISQYAPDNIYAFGIHAIKIYRVKINYVHIPFCFYNHMHLSPSIYWNYFHINESPNAHKLYQLLANSSVTDYVFTHNETGYGPLFSINNIEKHANISHRNILFINPNKNHYSSSSKFYQIAQKLVGHKINDYTQLMIHAKYLYLSDSSFFCLAMQLGILTDNCYLRSRGKVDYSYLWSFEYGFNNQIGHGSTASKKKFQMF